MHRCSYSVSYLKKSTGDFGKFADGCLADTADESN
jgi:hypothetical protein